MYEHSYTELPTGYIQGLQHLQLKTPIFNHLQQILPLILAPEMVKVIRYGVYLKENDIHLGEAVKIARSA